MTVMYSFCFWYSVRLGTIIVAFTCMVQCIGALIAGTYGLSNLERTSSVIDYWLQTSDLKTTKYLFKAISYDPKSFLIAFISFFSTYFLCCVLLIYAAFQCNLKFMYPFLILDFIRLVLLSLSFILILMLVKENTLNLGVIIGCSICGVFSLLYLWYQWFCAVSLWQVIREIKRLDHLLSKKPNIAAMNDSSREMNNLYNPPFYLPKVTN